MADVALVAEPVAVGLGRTLEGSLSAEDLLVDELENRQLLGVLDDFEQVAEPTMSMRPCGIG